MLSPHSAATLSKVQTMLSKRIEIKWEFVIFLVCSLFLLPLKLVINWILAAALHEVFHIAALSYFEIKIYKIILRGSGAIIETEPMPPKQEIICALAGPIGGLLGLLLFRINPYLAIFSLIQSAFNLLPFYPADGGRVLRCAITMKCGEARSAQISNFIGFVASGIIVLAGILSAYYADFPILPTFIAGAILAISVLKNSLQCSRKNSTI